MILDKKNLKKTLYSCITLGAKGTFCLIEWQPVERLGSKRVAVKLTKYEVALTVFYLLTDFKMYNFIVYYQSVAYRGSTVVKVLCYKSEGRWFDPNWCHWIFH